MKIDLAGITAKVIALESAIEKIRKNNPDLKIPNREEMEKTEKDILRQMKEKGL